MREERGPAGEIRGMDRLPFGVKSSIGFLYCFLDGFTKYLKKVRIVELRQCTQDVILLVWKQDYVKVVFSLYYSLDKDCILLLRQRIEIVLRRLIAAMVKCHLIHASLLNPDL